MSRYGTALVAAILGVVAGCAASETYSEAEARAVGARADSNHTRVVTSLMSNDQLSVEVSENSEGLGRFEHCKESSDGAGYVVGSDLSIPRAPAAQVREALISTFKELHLTLDERRENEFHADGPDDLNVDVTIDGPGQGQEIVNLAIVTSSDCLRTRASVARTLTDEPAHSVQ